ncbi:uncharacterized protein UHO2_00769 [Ustilago hordei]|uniref:uncharacterized protein n=1 Tax=Ustilago hordei TaxID=120017 RepID=UPI001A6318D1|nr:uncharacterized protein UHO2_00769 [Ustilago hordei]SYW73904.1 uncharacterized protein UHO2_00769 [Ustilago hordei]
MVRGKELSVADRSTIVTLHEQGMSYARIASSVGVAKTTVQRRRLVRQALKEPTLTWKQLSAELNGLSISRVRKLAYEADLNDPRSHRQSSENRKPILLLDEASDNVIPWLTKLSANQTRTCVHVTQCNIHLLIDDCTMQPRHVCFCLSIGTAFSSPQRSKTTRRSALFVQPLWSLRIRVIAPKESAYAKPRKRTKGYIRQRP